MTFADITPLATSLYRDEESAILLGVCSGLAERFQFNVLAARILAALALVFFTLPAGFVYLTAGVLLPRMARLTGVPVFFAVCARLRRGRYRVHIFKADDSIRSDDMRAALTAVNQGIEQCIAVDTSQYLWAYKRFRNRPEGEPPFYRGKN